MIENAQPSLVVQRWVHDLMRFRRFSEERRELLLGRRAESNDEIEEAPESAWPASASEGGAAIRRSQWAACR